MNRNLKTLWDSSIISSYLMEIEKTFFDSCLYFLLNLRISKIKLNKFVYPWKCFISGKRRP